MYTETEQLMDNMLHKALKNKRVKQAQEAVLYAPIAIVIMPFVSAFKKRKKPSLLNR